MAPPLVEMWDMSMAHLGGSVAAMESPPPIIVMTSNIATTGENTQSTILKCFGEYLVKIIKEKSWHLEWFKCSPSANVVGSCFESYWESPHWLCHISASDCGPCHCSEFHFKSEEIILHILDPPRNDLSQTSLVWYKEQIAGRKFVDQFGTLECSRLFDFTWRFCNLVAVPVGTFLQWGRGPNKIMMLLKSLIQKLKMFTNSLIFIGQLYYLCLFKYKWIL